MADLYSPTSQEDYSLIEFDEDTFSSDSYEDYSDISDYLEADR